jgi:hypothetical protein
VALRARLTTGSPFSQRPHTCATLINDRKGRTCQGLGGILRYYAVELEALPFLNLEG